jgi:hypothetical protein
MGTTMTIATMKIMLLEYKPDHLTGSVAAWRTEVRSDAALAPFG